MATMMTSAARIVKPSARSADLPESAAARLAHEKALQTIDRAITACEQLAETGDSAAAREAGLLAQILHRVSDPLFQTPTPVCQEGRWVR